MTNTNHRHTTYIIESFEAKQGKKRPFTVKLADNLTTLFGSIFFFIVNVFFFGYWIIANNGIVPGLKAFDPFPYPLLTTALSLEAIVLTIIVLMSQNRQSYISSLRDELELQVELIAEKEITKLLSLVKLIAEKQGIKLDDAELEEMLKQVDTSYIERKLSKELSEVNEPLTKQVADAVEKVGIGQKKE